MHAAFSLFFSLIFLLFVVTGVAVFFVVILLLLFLFVSVLLFFIVFVLCYYDSDRPLYIIHQTTTDAV